MPQTFRSRLLIVIIATIPFVLMSLATQFFLSIVPPGLRFFADLGMLFGFLVLGYVTWPILWFAIWRGRSYKANIKGHYQEAITAAERALAIWQRTIGPPHPFLAMMHNDIAAASRKLMLFEQAENHLLQSLAVLRASLGPEHSDLGHALNGLALLYAEQGHFDKAEPLYRRAIAGWGVIPADSRTGPNLPTSIPKVSPQTHALRSRSGRTRLLICTFIHFLLSIHHRLFRQTIFAKEAGICLHNLAQLRSHASDHSAAELLNEQARRLLESRAENTDYLIGMMRRNQSAVAMEAGRVTESEAEAREAVRLLERSVGRDHPD